MGAFLLNVERTNLERRPSIADVYEEARRYFMGKGTLNKTLTRLSLADVQELIKIRKLDADFASKLDPYVRTKYLELEEAVRKSKSIQEK